MDLFSSGLTTNQKLNKIKEDYKRLLEVEQNGKGKFTIIKGNKSNFGNCMLIIVPHVSESGFMNADYEKDNLMAALNHYDIDKYIIVYAQPSKSVGSSRKLIKKSRPIMLELIEIINPKLILVLDDSSSEIFLNMKPNIIELHGTRLAYHDAIPILLTYNMDYYVKQTGYEDSAYKKAVFFEDWNFINEQYKERINADI